MFQVKDTKYVFEAKTIQRMELLVLSTLQWKMHPVTPLSFLDHIIRRLGLKTHLHWEFLRLCERLLLSVVSGKKIKKKKKQKPITLSFYAFDKELFSHKRISDFYFFFFGFCFEINFCSDSRFMGYLPSVLATATMMRIIDHVEPCNAMEYQNQLLGVLKTSKVYVNFTFFF